MGAMRDMLTKYPNIMKLSIFLQIIFLHGDGKN